MFVHKTNFTSSYVLFSNATQRVAGETPAVKSFKVAESPAENTSMYSLVMDFEPFASLSQVTEGIPDTSYQVARDAYRFRPFTIGDSTPKNHCTCPVLWIRHLVRA